MYGTHTAYLIFFGPLHADSDKTVYINADTLFIENMPALYYQNIEDKNVALFPIRFCKNRTDNDKLIL